MEPFSEYSCSPKITLRTHADSLVSTVFQWAVPYIINEDAANLGVKGCYIFAGILVPTIVLIYFLYPEVSPISTRKIEYRLTVIRLPVERISSWTSSTSEGSQLGSSSRPRRLRISVAQRQKLEGQWSQPRSPSRLSRGAYTSLLVCGQEERDTRVAFRRYTLFSYIEIRCIEFVSHQEYHRLAVSLQIIQCPYVQLKHEAMASYPACSRKDIFDRPNRRANASRSRTTTDLHRPPCLWPSRRLD